mmetsp:Transcript_107487/g.210692  ORF Transcript_107487/g.210692 Transcript_107487/m.210692 type:complete len:411 (+) Transcript_107487:11-1243(+)
MKRASKIKKSSVEHNDGRFASSPASMNLSFMTVAKIAGFVLAVLLVATFWKKSQVGVQDLTKATANELKSVIFGDLPYLFVCAKGTKDEQLPAIFSDASTYKGSTMGFAKVNCSQVLPSGKTLFDRFKIKKGVRPTLFATAPWMKPHQVAANHLKDYATLAKYIDTAMAPKPTLVKSDKELQKFCGFDKNNTMDVRSIGTTCVVLLRGTRHSKVHSDLEKRLVLEYPRTRLAAVDATKMRLSLEQTTELVPADSFALKLHALRNGTHYMTMVNPATWDYLNTFVGQAVGTPLYGFSGDADVPTRLVKAKSATAAAKPKARTPKSKNKDNTRAKVEEKIPNQEQDKEQEIDPAVAAEAAEKERILREKLLREAMERAAEQHHFHHDDDGAEAGDDEGRHEEEEDEEEIIEL